MKKLFTLLLCVICATMMYAQDIIITKDSKRIEAKIIEVTSTTVKYKKWSYQDGPDIYEAKSNIAAIMWGNGEVEAFNMETEKKEIVIADVPVEKKEVVKKQTNLPYITKSGNTYITSDNQHLPAKEFEYYLEKNCRGAYDIWMNGVATRSAGWTLFGCGLSLDLISAISYSILGGYTPTSLACAITGSLCELACIPTLIVGYSKKQKAVNYYNSYCTKKQNNIVLNFGYTHNQLGIILTF